MTAIHYDAYQPTIYPYRLEAPELSSISPDLSSVFKIATKQDPSCSIPAYIPDIKHNLSQLNTNPPNIPMAYIPDASAADDGSGQDNQTPICGDFTQALGPFSKIQKKMKVISIAMLASAIAIAVLGLALIVTGSGLGLLPILVSLPLLYIGYNGYRVSENLARMIKNPNTVFSYNDVAQIDSQQIKQKLKVNTILFNPVIDKGTDLLLKSLSAAPAA